MGAGPLPGDALARAGWALGAVVLAGCLGARRGDTEGFQRRAEWWSGARIAVEDDSVLTVRRVSVAPGDHDVVIAAFDFNPSQELLGDEFSLSFAIDLGPPGAMEVDARYPIGGPAGLEAALGSRLGLGPILRPDSIRGELVVLSQGMMHTVARLEAQLFYSHWDDSTKVVVEPLRQRVDFLRPPARTPPP